MATATATPAPAQTSRVSAGTRHIPSTLVPAAVVLAVVVAVLSLLPSVAQVVWELPHLFLLGLVISYGVFAQKNAAAASDGEAAAKDGVRAWNSRYKADEPLVVVADHAGSDGEDGVGEVPFSLPVRRLKPVAEEPETGGDIDGGAIGEETDSSASTEGFWAGAVAAPSPPSVLNTFDSRRFNTTKGGFRGYDPLVPCVDESSNDGEEEEEEDTDWDEEADGSDEMTASSVMSFPGDFVACGGNRGSDGYSCDGESVVDEELLELATKVGPEGEEEVDRKADEFIAKFREQIRLQRL